MQCAWWTEEVHLFKVLYFVKNLRGSLYKICMDHYANFYYKNQYTFMQVHWITGLSRVVQKSFILLKNNEEKPCSPLRFMLWFNSPKIKKHSYVKKKQKCIRSCSALHRRVVHYTRPRSFDEITKEKVSKNYNNQFPL